MYGRNFPHGRLTLVTPSSYAWSRPKCPMPPSPSQYVHKHLKKMSKTIMKSHRVHLPKYDLPIRLRPVCLFSSSQPLGPHHITVVPGVYLRNNGDTRFPGFHQIVAFSPFKRQVLPLHLLVYCNRRVLLHIRRRRVSPSPLIY